MEAIPHPVLLDEGHSGFHRGGDVAGDQTSGAGTYHQQVVVKARRLAVGACNR